MSEVQKLINQALTFDYETKDPYISKGLGAGWVFSVNHPNLAEGFPICVVSHSESDGLKRYYSTNVNTTSYESLSEFSIDNEAVLCGQNLPYDLGWYLAQKFPGQKKKALQYLRDMYRRGVVLIDTKILAMLRDEHVLSTSLSTLAKLYRVTQKSQDTLAEDFWHTGAYAGYKMARTGQKTHTKPDNKTLLRAAYSSLELVTPSVVVDYCCDDVMATKELMHKLVKGLLKEYSDDELMRLLKRYSTMLYLSIDMRLRGVPVHIPTLRDACKSVSDKVQQARQGVMTLLQSYLKTKPDVDYMTKFLLQFYWHPSGKNKPHKAQLGARLKANLPLNELQKYWDKYYSVVLDFLNIVEKGDFDSIKFGGSSSHPVLMFLLSGYKKDDFSITKAGRVSTAKDWIESQDSELGNLLNRVRKVEKILSGFIVPAMTTQQELQTLEQEYGVVYPEFIVAGARSFRYTCRNPNLQQVPKRDEEFKPICRGMFHALPGQAFLAPDFSSQEQRLQVHVAYQLGAKGADKLKEAFDKDPNMDFHMMVARFSNLVEESDFKKDPDSKVVKAGRTKSKNISLGRAYGMGEAKLCKSLGLPTETKTLSNGKVIEIAGKEGKAIIDKYNNLMPFIGDTCDKLQEIVQKDGYFTTVCGRHVHAPYYLENNRRQYLYHKLFNYVIQGGAAGQLHCCLERLYDLMCSHNIEVVGLVHDEILIICDLNGINTTIRTVEHIMETSIKLNVPVVIDTQVGQSWLGGDLNVEQETQRSKSTVGI